MKSEPKLKPCPFCGGKVDPTGWMCVDGAQGPECEGCGATAPSMEIWQAARQQAVQSGYVMVPVDLLEQALKNREPQPRMDDYCCVGCGNWMPKGHPEAHPHEDECEEERLAEQRHWPNQIRLLLAAAPQAEQAVEPVLPDHDSIALEKARNIMQIMYSEMPKGGSVQLLGMVQVRILEAMSLAAPPAPDVSRLELFAKRAIGICEGEAGEWDSDDLIAQKNYAQACANRIRRLRDEFMQAHQNREG